MSFFTINRCLEYLGTLDKHDRQEVFRPIQFNVINYFGGDGRTYLQWWHRYVEAESVGKEISGHIVQYHTRTYKNKTDNWLQPDLLVNQTDLSTHQLGVLLPTEAYYTFPIIEDYQFDRINEPDIKEFNRNLSSAYYDIHGQNGIFAEQDYQIKIHKVQEYLLVTHTIKILMADCFYSHPDTKYWLANVEMNVPIDPDEMIMNLNIHFKVSFRNNKVQTNININNTLIESQWGTPICIFLVDNQYKDLEQYMYQGIEYPLEKIVHDVGEKLRLLKVTNDSLMYIYHTFEGVTADQLTAIAKFDAQSITHEIGVLDAKVQQLQSLRITVKVEDINLAVTSASSSFWGSLIGGIAGGALGALGQALNGALTTKGQIFDSLTDGVSDVLESKFGDSMQFLQGGWKALSSGQSLLKNKLFQMQQAVHDKFDTINNITSTIHTIDNWDETDEETGEKKTINLKKKIDGITKNLNDLNTSVAGMSEQFTTISGNISKINDKLAVIDHRFDIINNRFLDVGRKIQNLPSQIVPVKHSIPSPPTPPPVQRETVIPLTKPKDDLLDFLSTPRIKNILKVDGLYDQLEDHVLEITVYTNKLMETLQNIQSSKGLVASFTTGATPFSGSDL